MKKNFARIFYFLLAILVFGTMGIWIPAVIFAIDPLKTYDWLDALQNFMTFYIAIFAAACLDLLLMNESNPTFFRDKSANLLFLVFLVILGIGSVVANCILISKSNSKVATIMTIIFILGSCYLWWRSTENDPKFKQNPLNALGGSAQ